ncbi:hypothetical protein BC629DRAFT_579924 [Irpex lacteus]|nr:hypothetical protein BC629DRAFT_579924 [Irpex lacteus]
MVFALVNDISAVFFGCILASIFYGVTSIQTYVYFQGSQGDSVIYKLTYAWLWFLDTIQTIFMVYLVYSFGIVASVSHRTFQPDWRSSLLIIISNISDFTVRLVFMHRILLLTHRRWLVLTPITVISFVTTGLGISYGIRMPFRHFTELGSISWQLYSALATAVAGDIMITTTLCVLFHRMRSGFERSDSILTSLITYTISSGLLTRCVAPGCDGDPISRSRASLVAIATFTTYAVLPDTYVFMSVFFIMSKASFNSLLAATNARPLLREKMYGGTQAPQRGMSTAPFSSNQDTLVAASESLPATNESMDFFPRRLDATTGTAVSSWYSGVGMAV